MSEFQSQCIPERLLDNGTFSYRIQREALPKPQQQQKPVLSNHGHRAVEYAAGEHGARLRQGSCHVECDCSARRTRNGRPEMRRESTTMMMLSVAVSQRGETVRAAKRAVTGFLGSGRAVESTAAWAGGVRCSALRIRSAAWEWPTRRGGGPWQKAGFGRVLLPSVKAKKRRPCPHGMSRHKLSGQDVRRLVC